MLSMMYIYRRIPLFVQGAKMVHPYLLVLILYVSYVSADIYKIGVGIADVTGPAAEVNMMGYAQLEQNTAGIHTRLFSRAFIIGDNEKRVVFVSVDLGMISQVISLQVMNALKQKYGDTYTENNVCLSGTHTHSGPAGFLQYFMYIVPSLGFVSDNFQHIVAGIVKSIDMAHNNLKDGRIYWNEGTLLLASINRSPASYLNNPPEERNQYEHNVDKNMFLLKLVDLQGNPLGMINWFAVHGTSMNNTNKLISSDNKGYASILFEQDMNGNSLIGKGPFVAAFAQANEGDVSPNILGPRCIDTGLPCDNVTSTCNGQSNKCIAFGPGKDMFESTKIIGQRQYSQAKELFKGATNELSGPVQYIHQYVDMTKAVVRLNATYNVTTCKPAMGYSFAAGTTDGPGGFNFEQGTNNSNILINFIRNIIKKPSAEITRCQSPKPILLPTGEMKMPYDWQPDIVPLQILKIGDLAVVALPGEFTTMSGRRIRNSVKKVFDDKLPASTGRTKVVLAGLCNVYTSYVTTFEEYQLQRYEGGSTIYGPHTLSAYRQQFEVLATNLALNQSVSPGPSPPNLLKKQIGSLRIGVIYDGAPFLKSFGSIKKDVKPKYKIGETVSVTFVGAHPRNKFQLIESFLMVEKMNGTSSEVVATDANWETKFHWKRKNTVLGTSDVTITWNIPEGTEPGKYRIRLRGYRKSILGAIKPYKGTSSSFLVL